MRVLLVTPYYPEHGGGVEMMASELARRLADRGVHVCWAASGPCTGSNTAGITRLPMRTWNFTERLWGIPYPLWSPASLVRLVAAARRCDLVHLHDCLYLGNLVAFLSAQCLRKPVVVTQHVGWVPYRSWLPRLLLRCANRLLGTVVLGGCRRCVFIGEQVEAYFNHFVRYQHPPAFIPTGVDHARFHPVTTEEQARLRARLGLPTDRPVALFVGRFVEKKGLEHVQRLAARVPACEWVLIGWGPEDPGRWGLSNVRCMGKAAQHELIPYYQAADLLVLPSVGEGMPLVIQEAMACGTPVLISRQTALALTGLEEVTLVADVESDDLATQFRAAVAAPDQLRVRSREVASFARRHWDWKKCADGYHRLFAEVMERAWSPQPNGLPYIRATGSSGSSQHSSLKQQEGIHVFPNFPEGATRVHADRASGRDRHHRGPHWLAAARGPEDPRGRQPYPLRQQPQTDCPGHPFLP
jgi:glycosyltransferase involved in cell wall biosynthesis